MQEAIDVNIGPLIGLSIAEYKLQCIQSEVDYSSNLALYIPMIKYLLDELNANVFLLPHVYRVNPPRSKDRAKSRTLSLAQ